MDLTGSEPQSVEIKKNNFLVPKFETANVLKKREQFAVGLRKQKTKEIIKQKRRKLANIQTATEAVYIGWPKWKENHYRPSAEIMQEIFRIAGQNSLYGNCVVSYKPIDKIQILVGIIQNQDLNLLQQLAICTRIRMELSNYKIIDPSCISQLINDTPLVSVIMLPLNYESPEPELEYLRLEALWILVNLSYGNDEDLEQLFIREEFDFVNVINGNIERTGTSLQMVDQIMHLMGNLTENKSIRTLVCQNFNLTKLISSTLEGLNDIQKPIYTKNISWVAHNLSLAAVENDQILVIYNILAKCMEFIGNEQILEDVVGGLCKLSNNAKDDHTISAISGVYDTGPNTSSTMAVLIGHLGVSPIYIQKDIIHYLGQLLSFEDEKIAQEAVDNDIYEKMADILKSSNHDNKTVKEVVWTLSNICGNEGFGFQGIFLNSSVCPMIVSLTNFHDPLIASEALWVFCNIITCGSEDNIRSLVLLEDGCIISILLQALKQAKDQQLQEILLCLTKLLDNHGVFLLLQSTELTHHLDDLAAHSIQGLLKLLTP